MIIAGLLDGIDPGTLYGFLAIVLAGLGAWHLSLGIQVARKKLSEPPPDGRRKLDQPLVTKSVEVYVQEPDFNRKVSELKAEIGAVEGRVETLFRDRFHRLNNDLNAIKQEAVAGRELATEQFQKIEGELGAVKATSEHNGALAIRVEQSVNRLHEKLPETIANAIARSTPGRRA